MQQSSKGNPDFQGPFCGNSMQSRPIISTQSMEPIVATGKTHPQHFATIMVCPSHTFRGSAP
jgi:hypothetical protein